MTVMGDNLLKLIQSLDPLFPTGGYTLSNGMEIYTRDGIVHDGDSLRKHLSAYLHMLAYNDLAFAAKAHEGVDVKNLDELLSALRAPYELRSASVKQCARFLKLHTKMDNYPLLEHYSLLIKEKKCVGHYPIAIGLLIKETRVDLQEALSLYCYSILALMANQAAKLVPLRQLDGQIALHDVLKSVPEAVKRAVDCPMDELGISGVGFDLSSMRHEALASRLYIS